MIIIELHILEMDLEKFSKYLADDKYLNESLISEKEFNITVLPPDTLVLKLAKGTLSAVETVTAFVKKYLIMNNCVEISTLLERELSAAFAMATFLDNYFKTTGGTLGPLHGLPINERQLGIVKQACVKSNDDSGSMGSIPLSIVHHAALASPEYLDARPVQSKGFLFNKLAVHSGA